MTEPTPCPVCGATERWANGDCAPCGRARGRTQYRKDPALSRAQAKARYDKDPAKQIALTRAWQDANRDHVRAYQKDYYKTPEQRTKRAAQKRAWYIKNKAKQNKDKD
jgi:hypothetical protein